MIKILNQNCVRGTGVEAIYIGRTSREFPQASPLANPFRIGPDGTRDEVIAKYRVWLWGQMRDPQSAAYRELIRLAHLSLNQDISLLCYCAPRNCHGEVIVRAINYILEKTAREYISARAAGDLDKAELISPDLDPTTRVVLDVIYPAFTEAKDPEIPESHLWRPGKLEPVAAGDENFPPYVGQLFYYLIADELNDVDSSMSTEIGRTETICALFDALPGAAAETLRLALCFYLEGVEFFCSGAPYKTIAAKAA